MGMQSSELYPFWLCDHCGGTILLQTSTYLSILKQVISTQSHDYISIQPYSSRSYCRHVNIETIHTDVICVIHTLIEPCTLDHSVQHPIHST